MTLVRRLRRWRCAVAHRGLWCWDSYRNGFVCSKCGTRTDFSGMNYAEPEPVLPPRAGSEDVSGAERDLLLWASEVIDAMWYARYHGGQNGRDASKRWSEFRACGNKLNEWRLANKAGLTSSRTKEHRAEEKARRIRREVQHP